MATFEVREFGRVGERVVHSTLLRTASGYELEVLDYGASVRCFRVPTKTGLRDVVLGLDDLESYLNNGVFMGGIVGRVANRIGQSRFELEGKNYALFANDPPHHLHGGKKGWDQQLWSSKASAEGEGARVVLSRVSPDGEEGYPGSVIATTEYGLSETGELRVVMRALAERSTPLSMAQHNYWNLNGHDSGTVLDHEVLLEADSFTPATDRIPLGTITEVGGTALDFTTPRRLGDQVERIDGAPAGFDHNYVARGTPDVLRPVARFHGPKSGLTMTVATNQPGFQFYSGNFLSGSLSGKGATYHQYTGFCLESQAFPNAVNVAPWRSQVLLEAGQPYEHIMVFRFSAA